MATTYKRTKVAAVSHDGKLVALNGADECGVNLYRAADGSQVRQLSGRGRAVYGAAWGKGGRTIAWGDAFNRMKKRETTQPKAKLKK